MKRIISIIFTSCTVLTLCACGKQINSLEIINHLETKYNQEFIYIREGNDVWSSNQTSKIFSDKKGNEFGVKYFKNDIASLKDNYNSVVFDDEISSVFKSNFSYNYKLFASTQGEYTKNKFNNLHEYLRNISVLNIRIYTTESGYNIEKIKETLNNTIRSNGFNSYITVMVYEISNEDFNAIEKTTQIYNYINYSSFSFNN